MSFLKRFKQLFHKHPTLAISLVCIVLLTISFITHRLWFELDNILTGGDWNFIHDQDLKHYFSLNRGTWLPGSNFGSSNAQPNSILIMFLFGLIHVLFGFGSQIAAKILFFWPIIFVSCFSSTLLSYRISRNIFATLIGASVYIFSSYFLIVQTQHLNLAFVYALAPLTVWLFAEALERERLAYYLLFALIFSLGLVYEPRLSYLVCWILAVYLASFALWQKLTLRHLLHLGGGVIFTIFLNAFWLIPLLWGDSLGTISEITSRVLFGNEYMSMARSFFISQPFWSLEGATFFQAKAVNWFSAFGPMVALAAFFIPIARQSKTDKTWLYFFGLITLLGVFLGKQVANPFSELYPWLYSHFPGFSFFRESSKFHFISTFGYMGLTAIALSHLFSQTKSSRVFKYILGIIILSTTLLNLAPLWQNKVSFVFQESSIPSNYSAFNELLQSSDKEFKVLYLNQTDRFFYNDQRIQNILLPNLLFEFWSDPPIKNPTDPKKFTDMSYLSKEAFQKNEFYSLLQNANIKYIVQPEGKTTKRFYGMMPYYFQGMLMFRKETQKIPVEGLEYVWEVKDVKDPIFLRNKDPQEKLVVEKLHSSKYHLSFQNIQSGSGSAVIFSQKYNPNWQLYPETVATDVIQSTPTSSSGSYILNDNNFPNPISEISYFQQTPVNLEHNDRYYHLNQWLIDPAKIRELGASFYTVNEDGSINFDLVLYYKDQLYLYVGILISLGTLLVCMLYSVIRLCLVFKKR